MRQDYEEVEYIIIDGQSTDNTDKIIKSYCNRISKYLREKDSGIYDAMNKGIQHATGDIIGFLNSDDLYARDNILSKVIQIFKEKNIDSCYGDLVYVDVKNKNKVIRYWKSSCFKRRKFHFGWMPPHPTFFVKKKIRII